MRYLKNDYLFPVVVKADFRTRLGATYQRRAASPKIIIKGLTLLDGALDLDGAYVPGKSTIVFCSSDAGKLKLLAGIVNSRFASFYVKQKYASASYNGGVNFTPDMLNSIPLPPELTETAIIAAVDAILGALKGITEAGSSLLAAIRASSPQPSLRRQFDSWPMMEAPVFIGELLKQGLAPSLTERGEWADLLERSKALAAQHVTAYTTAKHAIDRALFSAFNLNNDEIEQLESAI